ncbi:MULTISPECIES: anhydro-N-acetylmuramic acid kinase [unclassified Oleiphilus]|nr:MULTISPECIES: anhydro-N-acetylmuramic acid kinase [unclassified Oleiphilus]KZY48724.1 hypothetical protein A3732_05640 [Oleiphilus sp. HI0050]KZZ31459.1 hypothetical protein A3756_06940 [Oleiphilus sp. HI0086]KZZ39936.1 hypothetical protein A3757_05770 [Oleiphilus sp. HI0117]KZZ57102.1 hypothetical protein A3761_07005 [Oleiphilus sp. HI0123]
MADKLYIGVMSGTSMDGIDTVLASISENKTTSIESFSAPFSSSLKSKLQSLSLPGDNEIDRLGEASVELGEAIAETVNDLLKKANKNSSDVCAIGCHGQTIRHRPESSKPFSLQIGDPSTIAHITNITTITDFRMADMAAKGQGAPLVPAFHQAVFGDSNETRIVANIGGIANISVLSKTKNKLSGYDTGPGNMLMDLWIQSCLKKAYDHNGDWASTGSVIEDLLQDFLDEPYFKQTAPKSTGKELFNSAWIANKIANSTFQSEDIQRTLLELTASTISNSIITSTNGDGCDIFVCGGGINNQLLMTRLQNLLPSYRLSSTLDLGIDPQLVEASAFAWLARQTLNNLPGNACSVTGASKSKILGGIYPA